MLYGNIQTKWSVRNIFGEQYLITMLFKINVEVIDRLKRLKLMELDRVAQLVTNRPHTKEASLPPPKKKDSFNYTL